MKLMKKIRVLGAAAVFFLMASPLARAADKSGLSDVLKAQELLFKEPAVQYNLKGTFFTPLGIGTVAADGQFQDKQDKKEMSNVKLEGQGKAVLTVLGQKNPVEKPFAFYAIQDGDKMVKYGSDGKSWVKETDSYTPATDKDFQKAQESLKKNIKAAKVVSNSGRQKVIDVTVDSQKLFMTDKRNTQTDKQKAVVKALKKMEDLQYRVVIDKKTHKLSGVSMDLTPVLQTAGKEILDAARLMEKITGPQQEMADALLKGSTLKIEMTFAYDKGKDIVLPEAAKNAKEKGSTIEVKTAK